MRTVSYSDIAIRRFLATELERLQKEQHEVLLDLGCGARPYQSLYEGRFPVCIAADFEKRGAIHVQLDATALPFCDSSIDVILCSEVIEHVPDARAAIREISRVLKPTGRLLLTWPFNYMLHEVPNDYVRYTEFGMQSLLRENGVRIERIVRRGDALALFLTIVEFFVAGAIEIGARTPGVGPVFRTIKPAALRLFFEVPYRLHLGATWRGSKLERAAVGAGLHGVAGHASHWTLGYCATARKIA